MGMALYLQWVATLGIARGLTQEMDCIAQETSLHLQKYNTGIRYFLS